MPAEIGCMVGTAKMQYGLNTFYLKTIDFYILFIAIKYRNYIAEL